MKRLVAIIMTIAMAASAFSGCNSGSGNSSAAGSSSGADSSTAADSSAAVDSEADTSDADDAASGEVEELTVMVWDRGNAAPGTTNEDNALTDYIKDRVLKEANVEVSYMAVPRSGSDDKLNVMMAGGSAPGIVFSYGQDMFTNYASNGGLTDLTEPLATYGDQIMEFTGDVQPMGLYEGQQFAIMKKRSDSASRHVQYIRKDWLDKLGMDMPKTKDEFFEALYAFKEKNPGEVDNVIPWMMSGVTDTEKNYLNFIGSYTGPFDETTKRDEYVYSEAYLIFRDGAVEGIKKMNQLYNDGLIYNDFVSDTNEDIWRQEISSGNAGFVLSDRTQPWELFEAAKADDPTVDFQAVSTFELSDGSYRNPAEPYYGMFIMVPQNRSEMANAAVKYLNWMADPAVAEDILYSPDHSNTENGVPIPLTEEEAYEHGYPGTMADLNILNDKLAYSETKEGVVESYMQWNSWEEKPWFENSYDIIFKDGYFVYDTYPAVIQAEAEYGNNIKTLSVEYVYKLICCDPAEFDALQEAEYAKLVSAGLEDVLNERGEWYDANVGK